MSNTQATETDVVSIPAILMGEGMVLVGESGNRATIYAVRNNSLIPGFVSVETEFGFLVLDNDHDVTFPVERGSIKHRTPAYNYLTVGAAAFDDDLDDEAEDEEDPEHDDDWDDEDDQAIEDEPDEDDLAWARETLGESATRDEVLALAEQRVAIRDREGNQ